MILNKKDYELINKETIPVINKEKHKIFLLNYQKALIEMLLKRNLLTEQQKERCIIEIERRYRYGN